MKKVAIVYHSGYGHTESLVPNLKSGLESEGVQVSVFKITELSPELKELEGFDGMMLGSPTYMGNISWQFKKFMEDSVKIWFARGWKNRLAGGFTVSGVPSGSKDGTMNSILTFAIEHGMIWCGVEEMPSNYTDKTLKTFDENARNRAGAYKGLFAQAENAPAGENNPAKGDHETAVNYGKRFAQILKRFN